MHELALADAVVTSALEVAEREGMSRITRVVVTIGELQQIRREAFDFCLKQVCPESDPRLHDAAFEIQTEKAVCRCRGCDGRFSIAEGEGERGEDDLEAIHFVPELVHAYLRCPSCGSVDYEVTSGRGVTIQTIEGEKPDD